MAFSYIVVAILASSVAVFALQNSTPVAVRFLLWTAPETSVAVLGISAFVAGVIVAGAPLALARWRLRRRAKELAVRLRQLEVALADRDRALLGLQRGQVESFSEPPAA